MSVREDRGAWEVRWRDSDGRRRAKRFRSEPAARELDAALLETQPAARSREKGRRADGVYSYATSAGVRWRFVYRRSDGSQTTKRGFPSEKVARDARRRLIEQIERGELRHTKETFDSYWTRWLERRRPYLESNTWRGYDVDGRLRLLPAFGQMPLTRIGVDDVRRLVATLAEGSRPGPSRRRRSTTRSARSSSASTRRSRTA